MSVMAKTIFQVFFWEYSVLKEVLRITKKSDSHHKEVMNF